MLQVGVVTLFPDLISSVLNEGVIGRAITNETLRVNLFQPRDYVKDPHKTIDDRPFGGSPGMVMMPQPLSDALNAARGDLPNATVIAVSPQGEKLTQSLVDELSHQSELIFVAGRYEGIDERFLQRCIDREVSIGDYVLSGGELPVLVILDAVIRLLTGTLGNEESAKEDSFVDNLLEGPQYTRPRDWDGSMVPEVLVSGDHGRIESWRREQSLARTWERRPDLLLEHQFSETERAWLRDYLSNMDNNRKEK